MKSVFAWVVALLLGGAALVRAQSPDQQYIGIYTTIQEADSLLETGQPRAATARYLEAQTALKRLQTGHPDWNPRVVKFRLSYIAAKVATATARVGAMPPVETPQAPAPSPAEPAIKPAEPSPALLRELQTLREQVGQLQADKSLLEAKLKESLAVQPAALDPRELAKAEERIRALEKETDLLKVTLEQERAKKPAAGDSAAVDRLKRELAESNRQRTEQAALAKTLAGEKAALQQQQDAKSAAKANELAKARERIASLEQDAATLKATLEQERASKPAAADTAAMDRLRQELAEANRRAGDQSDLAKSLAQEKTEIQKRLDALAAAPTSNTELAQTKQALAEANRRLADQSEANQQLARDKQTLLARVQTLTADAEALAALRTENELLKKQVADLKTPAVGGDAGRDLQQARARIAALQSDLELLRLEKTALENRVKALSASAVISPAPTASARGTEGESLTTLRARLAVLEARPVPYTAEELALMKKPEPRLATITPRATKPSAQEAPASSATLIAEAQRQFAARQYDKAEENYRHVLRQDNRNVGTLANLAVIQMELNRFDEAEKHARQAITVAPNDAQSHSVLGQLKLRQEKYSEAVDALSQAAQLNSKSAEVQNFLGIALSHQGLRVPAETALRKAIQLEPGYGSAHNNLAVIYLNQAPPMVALARWHYQKALAVGHPKNPELEKALEVKQAPASAP